MTYTSEESFPNFLKLRLAEATHNHFLPPQEREEVDSFSTTLLAILRQFVTEQQYNWDILGLSPTYPYKA